MKNTEKFEKMTTLAAVASAGLTTAGQITKNRSLMIGGAIGWGITMVVTQASLKAKLNEEIKKCERYKEYVNMEWETSEIEILNNKTRKIIAIKARNKFEAAEAIKELTNSIKEMREDVPVNKSVTFTEKS